LLTTLLALIPFLGAASVWIPVALWLYLYQGRTDLAVGMTLYGVLIISLVDNLIKPLVLHGQSKLHPLLAAMSVLGGVQALGPIGILIGPMAVVFLQTLAKILHREYKSVEGKVNEAAAEGAKSTTGGTASPPVDIKSEACRSFKPRFGHCVVTRAGGPQKLGYLGRILEVFRPERLISRAPSSLLAMGRLDRL
jgi:hypothetical protein